MLNNANCTMSSILKRGLLFITIVALTPIVAFSQYYYIPYLDNQGVPGQYNTQVAIPANTLSSSWTQIKGSSATSVWSPTQNIPFSFTFNGQAVTQYKASTSGILTFDTSATLAPDTIPENLPSVQIPEKSVCI